MSETFSWKYYFLTGLFHSFSFPCLRCHVMSSWLLCDVILVAVWRHPGCHGYCLFGFHGDVWLLWTSSQQLWVSNLCIYYWKKKFLLKFCTRYRTNCKKKKEFSLYFYDLDNETRLLRVKYSEIMHLPPT